MAMRRWDERQYDVLFGDHPPTEPQAPTADECAVLGRSLGRSSEAIRSQWDDGRSLVLGHATDASSGLRDYLL
jgi:hypothetical protein